MCKPCLRTCVNDFPGLHTLKEEGKNGRPADRMREGAGRRSSRMDEIRPTRWTAQFTRELLWVLEGTVERWPALAELLAAVVEGERLGAEELPEPAAWERAATRLKRQSGQGAAYAQANL